MDINKWNNSVLASKGIKHKGNSPKVVRSLGDAKRATLGDGTVVERKDYMFVDGYGLVRCMNTNSHFIYSTPEKQKGWGMFCTCGAIAGVIGWKEYSKFASPQDTGFVIACIRYVATKQNTGVGVHADNSHD